MKSDNGNSSISGLGNPAELPGQGWSNGDIAPSMFPITHEGRLQLYSSHRRWIGLQHGWTRIGGEGSTEFDARHSISDGIGHSLVESEEHEAQTVRGACAGRNVLLGFWQFHFALHCECAHLDGLFVDDEQNQN